MMMIERSVVERAMEALVDTAWGKHPDRKEARESIDDLRAALKQQDEPVWMHPWPPVRAQQEEPVQEPVAALTAQRDDLLQALEKVNSVASRAIKAAEAKE